MSDMTSIIGQNIQRLRERRGLSQCKLEAIIGSNQGAVSRWEKGMNAPSAYFLFRLAKALNCSVDSLYAGVPG